MILGQLDSTVGGATQHEIKRPTECFVTFLGRKLSFPLHNKQHACLYGSLFIAPQYKNKYINTFTKKANCDLFHFFRLV